MTRIILVLLLSVLSCAAPHPALRARAVKVPAVVGGGGATIPPGLVASNGVHQTSGTSMSTNITVPTGADLGALIFVGQGRSTTPRTITSVTITNQTATAIPGFVATDGNFCHVSGFYVVGPSNGTIAVTANWTGTADQISLICLIFTNFATADIFGTAHVTNNLTGTGITNTVASATTELVVASAFTDSSTILVSLGLQAFELENIGGGDTSHSTLTRTGLVSQVTAFTQDSSTGWASGAVSVRGKN